jgi:hypothetical protein
MENRPAKHAPHLFDTLLRKLIGAPRDIEEPSLFQKISLIPVLVTHVLLIAYGVFNHVDRVASVAADFQADFRRR